MSPYTARTDGRTGNTQIAAYYKTATHSTTVSRHCRKGSQFTFRTVA